MTPFMVPGGWTVRTLLFEGARTMDPPQEDTGKPEEGPKHPITFTAASASGSDEKGSTLLPMLIAGLVLIVVGMVAVVLIF